MGREANDGTARPDDRGQPRRSALVQTRSRNTRRQLIRSALELWSDEGFDEAFEATSAEDIAKAAGVSRGTFYFHFAHKDDILLEMPWATAELMVEEASDLMERQVDTDRLVAELLTSLAGRVGRAPRAAVLRVTGHWSRLIHTRGIPEKARSFAEAFEGVARYGVDRGDLPLALEVEELSRLLQAATMDALVSWAATDQSAEALRASLCRRADVILSGAVVSYGR